MTCLSTKADSKSTCSIILHGKAAGSIPRKLVTITNQRQVVESPHKSHPTLQTPVKHSQSINPQPPTLLSSFLQWPPPAITPTSNTSSASSASTKTAPSTGPIPPLIKFRQPTTSPLASDPKTFTYPLTHPSPPASSSPNPSTRPENSPSSSTSTSAAYVCSQPSPPPTTTTSPASPPPPKSSSYPSSMASSRPVPTCYEDSWAALQRVTTHADGTGLDKWLKDYADFNRLFIGGDIVSGNITRTLVSRIRSVGLSGVKVVGAIVSHSYFGGTDDDKMWLYINK